MVSARVKKIDARRRRIIEVARQNRAAFLYGKKQSFRHTLDDFRGYTDKITDMPKSGENIKTVEDCRQSILCSGTVRFEKRFNLDRRWKNKITFKVLFTYYILVLYKLYKI